MGGHGGSGDLHAGRGRWLRHQAQSGPHRRHGCVPQTLGGVQLLHPTGPGNEDHRALPPGSDLPGDDGGHGAAVYLGRVGADAETVASHWAADVACRCVFSSVHQLGVFSPLWMIRREALFGIQNQPDFINGAFLIETIFEIEELKSSLKDIESHLGQTQTADKFGPRTIDLDVLVWNNTVVNKDVYERAFIQASIAELIPDFKI